MIVPVVAIAIAALAVLSVTRATDNVKKAARQDLVHRTQLVASNWNDGVNSKLDLARSMAVNLPGVLSVGPAVMTQFLGAEASLDTTAQALLVALPKSSPKALEPGVSNTATGAKPLKVTWGALAPDLALVKAHPVAQASEPLIYGGEATSSFIAPVRSRTGAVVGAAMVAGSLQQMFGADAAQKIYKSGYIMAVSAKGRVLLSPSKKLDGTASLSSLAASRHLPALRTIAAATAARRGGQLVTNDPIHGTPSVASWAPIGTTGWSVITFAPRSQVLASANSLRTTLIIVSVGVLIVLALVISFVVRRLTKPVAEVTAVAERLSEGDVDVAIEVSSQDEIGRLAAAFQRTIDYLREKAGVADQIAAGDLTVAVAPRSERDVLGQAFAKLVVDLRGIVGRVTTSARGVAGASQEMAANSEEAGRATGEVARAVTDVASGAERQVQMVLAARQAAEDVAQAIEESTRTAQETAAAAGQAREVAHEGVQAAEQATAAMQEVRESSQAVTEAIGELAAKSQQIGAIVVTITGIAEQTNLLALNAAIEAARAGEQGRGFAVVAEEVRKLAEESQTAAEEIGDLIQAMQSETDRAVSVVERGAEQTGDGAATVERTREAFERIGSSVEDMTARIEQIAAAAEQVAHGAEAMQQHMGEVAAVAEQSSAATQEVSASTEETTASTQEISSSAAQLASTASELEDLVGSFRLQS